MVCHSLRVNYRRTQPYLFLCNTEPLLHLERAKALSIPSRYEQTELTPWKQQNDIIILSTHVIDNRMITRDKCIKSRRRIGRSWHEAQGRVNEAVHTDRDPWGFLMVYNGLTLLEAYRDRIRAQQSAPLMYPECPIN